MAEWPELAAFRLEAAEWVRATLADQPIKTPTSQRQKEDRARWWQERCAADGWLGLSWPVEYGGRGLGAAHEAVFNAEAQQAGAPLPVNFLALIMVGPVLLEYGTEEQKRACLPRILSAEEVWCIGFSEPGAGSDLASVRTRAELRADGWHVTGQKVWTSWAHIAQRCLLLARTAPDAPSHRGLTMFLADMAGADARPIRMINDEYDFNEVFLDDLLVPRSHVLGEPQRGWEVALAVLGFERRAIPFILYVDAERELDRLCAALRASGRTDDPAVASGVGRLWAEVASLRHTTQRCLAEIDAGRDPGAPQLTLKLEWARTMQSLTRFAASQALAGYIDDRASWTARYLRARANSIESGTDEVLLSLIAEQVLELPRSR